MGTEFSAHPCELMKEAHEKGTPVLEAGAKTRRVYLPGSGVIWKDAWNGQEYPGGSWITVQVTLEDMPVFVKKD
ncbi:TIM-barrel domain-containing protein [Marvinbryantia sp.]|uniref:TIM-barrel domain-containing protein n=1 Tax=Marvinbryantia sp. TaxID=2496532 RepID=UPI0025F06041|nr:TIM-barrel domain-containing protein [uncultured Marvinbryantia sp.]